MVLDITGRWRGHYEQEGGRHGIRMDVVQRGESFVGEMRDQDTVLSGSASIEVAGADDASTRRLEAETMGVLPEVSVVEGTIDGHRVVFDKRYLGQHTLTMWVPDEAVLSHTIDDHRVRYEGTLDASGRCIAGEWRIRAPVEDLDDATGRFELWRQ